MKKIFLCFLFSTFLIPLFAYNLSGKIIDSASSNPLDFVNVALYKQDGDAPIKGIVTDENGHFQISSVENGKYTLQFSFVGYNTYSRNFTVNGKDMNFGNIRLTEDSKMLSELEVVGMSSQMRFEIDRKVFSVDQNIAAAGGSASEVLENIPSVEVDQEGNISLRNNESVEVWINGKPSGLTAENRAQILQQMPAESIESIEVITNPSAKFDPEGTAGIINLVLKKNRKAGYYGSVSGGLMYPDGGTLGGSLGANINFSSSKIDAYANIGYRAMSRVGGSYSELESLYADSTTMLTQDNKNTSKHKGLFFRAGIDYHINDKNTIGISGMGMNGGGDTESNVDYLLKDNRGAELEKYYRRNEEDGNRNHFNLSMDYKHEFNKKGTELLANLSYSRFRMSNPSVYHQTDVFPTALETNIEQNSTSESDNLQFKLDYTNKISETGRLEAGWQSNISNRYSDSDGFDISNGTIPLYAYFNIFDYSEQIHAAYITYGERFFEKLSAQAGLRGEYMLRNMESKDINGIVDIDYEKSYFELFPSLYLGYSITKRDEIQLNYTRRISRPRGHQVNPFRDYSDPTNISFGNGSLTPEFSSAFELNYLRSWDNHSLSASAYYRFTDDVVQRISYMLDENEDEEVRRQMESTYMNISQSQSSGVELVAKNRLFKILNLTSSVNFYYGKVNQGIYINPNNGIEEEVIKGQESFSWNARVMGNIMFSPTFTGQVAAQYRSPRAIAQGRQESDYSIDLGLRKSFFNRNLNVSVNVRDLLDSRRRKSTTSGEGFNKYSESYWHGRTFGLTVSYNFGNMQPKRNQRINQSDTNSMDMDTDSMD